MASSNLDANIKQVYMANPPSSSLYTSAEVSQA
jgi:hypothetical protein